MKQYLDLPELLGLRIVNQINANGDERIDHDEFVDFFLQLTMGSFEQKMKIAFACYDADGDESISEDEVELILRSLPLRLEERYGSSFNPLHGNRFQKFNEQKRDCIQIRKFTYLIFNETFYSHGMYFDEFCTFAKEVSSELIVSIFDALYHRVPCVKNFLRLKMNFYKKLKSDEASKMSIKNAEPLHVPLMPPVLEKSLRRFFIDQDPDEGQLLGFSGNIMNSI